MTTEQTIKEIAIIPAVGMSLTDLWNIGIKSIADLKGQNSNKLYDLSNAYAGTVQYRCVLHVFGHNFKKYDEK